VLDIFSKTELLFHGTPTIFFPGYNISCEIIKLLNYYYFFFGFTFGNSMGLLLYFKVPPTVFSRFTFGNSMGLLENSRFLLQNFKGLLRFFKIPFLKNDGTPRKFQIPFLKHMGLLLTLRFHTVYNPPHEHILYP